jgi:protein-L-isoaspartate(D-aspartate) O-methyltransferase
VDTRTARTDPLSVLAATHCEPFATVDGFDTAPLLERIGDAQVVLIGEATHGTSEFYRMRARITRALVEQRGFRIVAVEADWPDAARLDRYVRDRPDPDEGRWPVFARFPSWMWRNLEVSDFVQWLRGWNLDRSARERAGFFGLDLYSLYRSIGAVLEYLDREDPTLAAHARQRYGCLDPWAERPADYGHAAAGGRGDGCEAAVVENLRALLGSSLLPAAADGDDYLDAVQNAQVVANAERYYRLMYRGSRQSWNLRDTHMFETLLTLRRFHGHARAVVWAHNSHVGDASATDMGEAGEINIGSLSREHWGNAAYLIGFGTDRGTVAAASDWDGPKEIKRIRPARDDSFEGAMRQSGVPGFMLPLRGAGDALREAASQRRLERAIGVIYRPETERYSHYFMADLARQFDEYIWIETTTAVTEIEGPHQQGAPELYPFAV